MAEPRQVNLASARRSTARPSFKPAFKPESSNSNSAKSSNPLVRRAEFSVVELSRADELFRNEELNNDVAFFLQSKIDVDALREARKEKQAEHRHEQSESEKKIEQIDARVSEETLERLGHQCAQCLTDAHLGQLLELLDRLQLPPQLVSHLEELRDKKRERDLAIAQLLIASKLRSLDIQDVDVEQLAERLVDSGGINLDISDQVLEQMLVELAPYIEPDALNELRESIDVATAELEELRAVELADLDLAGFDWSAQEALREELTSHARQLGWEDLQGELESIDELFGEIESHSLGDDHALDEVEMAETELPELSDELAELQAELDAFVVGELAPEALVDLDAELAAEVDELEGESLKDSDALESLELADGLDPEALESAEPELEQLEDDSFGLERDFSLRVGADEELESDPHEELEDADVHEPIVPDAAVAATYRDGLEDSALAIVAITAAPLIAGRDRHLQSVLAREEQQRAQQVQKDQREQLTRARNQRNQEEQRVRAQREQAQQQQRSRELQEQTQKREQERAIAMKRLRLAANEEQAKRLAIWVLRAEDERRLNNRGMNGLTNFVNSQTPKAAFSNPARAQVNKAVANKTIIPVTVVTEQSPTARAKETLTVDDRAPIRLRTGCEGCAEGCGGGSGCTIDHGASKAANMTNMDMVYKDLTDSMNANKAATTLSFEQGFN